jgi:hypothetical protein
MSDQGQKSPKLSRDEVPFPRPQEGPKEAYKTSGVPNGLDPYGTTTPANPRFGIMQGSRSPGIRLRDTESNTDGAPTLGEGWRASHRPDVDVPPRSGAHNPGCDEQVGTNESSIAPYANARGRVNRGAITRVPNG